GEGAARLAARHPLSRGAGHLCRGAGVLRGEGSAAAGVPPDDAGDGDLHVRDERDQPGQRDRLRRPLRLGQHRHRGAVAGEPAGRIAAQAVLMVPGVVAAMIVLPLLYGYGELVPLAVMGALGALICGFGISMMVSVLLPYPSSPPGTNPMKDKSASSSNAM